MMVIVTYMMARTIQPIACWCLRTSVLMFIVLSWWRIMDGYLLDDTKH